MWHLWETGEVHTGLWCGDLREREHFKISCVNGRIILIWIFKEWDGRMDWLDLAQVKKSGGLCCLR
jgi:hypothetical protein